MKKVPRPIFRYDLLYTHKPCPSNGGGHFFKRRQLRSCLKFFPFLLLFFPIRGYSSSAARLLSNRWRPDFITDIHRTVFWPLLAKLCHETPPEGWDARRAMLRRHGVALWDVIERCEREGSTDARIRNPVVADVPALLQQYPNICAAALNGSLAAKLFAANEALPRIKVFPLPSTSPIPRRDIRNIDDLYARWRVLEPYLQPEDAGAKY